MGVYNSEGWAMFYTAALLPLKEREQNSPMAEIRKELRDLSWQYHTCPDGKRRKISLRTWIRRYKRMTGDFRNQMRKQRKDKSIPRSLTGEIVDRAIEIKKDMPTRSCSTIIKMLESEGFNQKIAKSSLSRHLLLAGATTKVLQNSTKNVRRPFIVENVNDLWVGDFQEGPYVLHNGNFHPTYLSAFIDDRSRYIVSARYYLKQTLDVLSDSFLRAIAIAGAPKRVYTDNAKVYHSNALKEACLKLQTRLIFRKPRQPEGGGVIERFFQTSQNQFENEVRAGKPLSLEQLNERFFAWINISYHKSPNRTIKAAPADVFNSAKSTFRYVSSDLIKELFYLEEERIVDKRFSWISFKTHNYNVPENYRGQKVIVRYDPFNFDQVTIFTRSRQYICTSDKDPKSPPSRQKPEQAEQESKINYLDMILDEHKKNLADSNTPYPFDEKLPGIERDNFSFLAFRNCAAYLLGREPNSFITNELEKLTKLYQSSTAINEQVIKTAAKKNNEKTVDGLIYWTKITIREGGCNG